MHNLTQREQSLLDALNTRLADADALTAQQIIKEIEAASEYNEPGHPDHVAYLHMIPLAIGREMELAGQDPNGKSSQLDMSQQRFTHDLNPQEPMPDFSDEDSVYENQRKNTVDYLEKLQAGEVEGVDPEDQKSFITGGKQHLAELDAAHEQTIKNREAEIDRMNKQKDDWDKEKFERSANMKKEFMETRLRDVLKDDRKKITELAEQEWATLQDAYDL